MAAGITVNVDDSKLEQKLQALEKANLAPVFNAVGDTILNKIRLCFKLSRDPWGTPWAPLKFRAPRRTNDGKRLSKTGRLQVAANKAGKPGQPLMNTRQLRDSIVMKADATGVTIGSNLKPKAPVHQFGRTIVPKTAKRLVFPGPTGALIFAKKVVIPARPFLPLTATGETFMPQTWNEAIVDAIKVAMTKKGKA